jgi:beta-galactosidase
MASVPFAATGRRAWRIAAGAATGIALLAATPLAAQQAKGPADWVGGGGLFVGTCYQPVDRSPAQVTRDIAQMKRAGLQIVRMGDLSWDYFEPREGEFTFTAFDSVMAQMQAAGIKVILDIGGSIPPPWLYQRYPAAMLVREDGATLYPARRYMVDISDPNYRRLLHRFADALVRRYGRHPAVSAIGYNNEMGNGYPSYSEPTRQRFIAWLKTRYADLPALNRAWATQRWSRTITDWDQVRIPNTDGPSANERYLDMRRFWSDAAVDLLGDLDGIRRAHAPRVPAVSNLWSDGRLGFDYLATYRRYVTHGAFGYYATNPLYGAFETLMMKGGMVAPVWFNEFQAGGEGFYGEKGRSRMLGYFGLLNGGQGMLAWTFNSHLGGEEQIIFGLLDHDDTPSWKLEEWGRISREFHQLQTMGFPRRVEPAVALSYSWETRQITGRVKQYYVTPYMDHKYNAFSPLFGDNVDVAVINISHDDLSKYKLLVIAGEYLMDQAAIDAVRRYVAGGGTAIMTASSDKVDSRNQWYATPLPGGLTDVFGLRTNAFYTNPEPLTGTIDGTAFKTSINTYEVLEPSKAQVTARFANVDGTPPAVTINRFGKGRAIYVAAQAQPAVLQPLYRQLYRDLGIVRGPVTPKGVYARVVDGRTLYVNTNRKPVDIAIDGTRRGVLSDTAWTDTLRLPPNGVDLLQKP